MDAAELKRRWILAQIEYPLFYLPLNKFTNTHHEETELLWPILYADEFKTYDASEVNRLGYIAAVIDVFPKYNIQAGNETLRQNYEKGTTLFSTGNELVTLTYKKCKTTVPIYDYSTAINYFPTTAGNNAMNYIKITSVILCLLSFKGKEWYIYPAKEVYDYKYINGGYWEETTEYSLSTIKYNNKRLEMIYNTHTQRKEDPSALGSPTITNESKQIKDTFDLLPSFQHNYNNVTYIDNQQKQGYYFIENYIEENDIEHANDLINEGLSQLRSGKGELEI